MWCIGGSVFQRMMRSLHVANIHRLTYQVLRALQQQFSFQNPVHPFRQRILVTVIPIGHRAFHPVHAMTDTVPNNAAHRGPSDG